MVHIPTPSQACLLEPPPPGALVYDGGGGGGGGEHLSVSQVGLLRKINEETDRLAGESLKIILSPGIGLVLSA